MAKAPAPSHPEESPAHDPLAAALGPSPAEKFIAEHTISIVAGLLLLIVGVSAAIWFSGTREEKALQTAQAFSKATSLSELDQIIVEYPGSTAAGNAVLRKAAILEEEGKLDEARAAWVELRETYPEHPLVDQASLALARVAADANEMEKARDFLSEIPSNSDLAALAQLKLGDLAYREGDLVKAKTIYEPILANYPVNPWSSQVTERLQDLKLEEAKATTPAPPAKPKAETKPETEAAAPVVPSTQPSPASEAPAATPPAATAPAPAAPAPAAPPKAK